MSTGVSTQPSQDESRGLVRAIGRWSLVALVINTCIGGGIFGVPTVAASLVGKDAWLAWLIGGAANAPVMACYAEVGSRFRVAGGSYIFARAALGRLAAIQVGWFSLLIRVLSAAGVANVFVGYLGSFFPTMTQPAKRAMVLAGVLGGLAIINVLGVRSGAALSNVFTVSKLVPLFLLASVGGILALLHGSSGGVSVEPVADPQWLRAILLMGYGYGGYDTAMMPLGESKNPQRDVPFALGVSLAVMVALFIVIQAVTTYWVGIPVTDHPLADAAQRFLGGAGVTIVSLGALISCFGHMSGNVLGVPRVTFALAQNGDFPGFFGSVHRRFRTPWISIILFAGFVWTFANFGSFRWNAFVSSAGRLVVYCSVAVALIMLRRREHEPAPFTLPGGVGIALVAIAICGFLLSQMGGGELVVMLITLAVGTLNWVWARRKAT